ncbi:tripartite motif-containing protein 16-like protein isoform X2 [Echeneis naucrates]|uniref:Tripartite motif-containing protein 16-like protein n=1 Tax=Echeneis naucrates TaxID=173247 RepID=A0A665U7X3_ECHNA|nr:tripartite motif-containing protein 16-like protein isoform X2 [Echeneis naucrates]
MNLNMSPPEEPSQDKSESRIHDDIGDDKNVEDEDVKGRGFLKTQLRQRRLISPLNLLKEDFSQFKEDVLKVFRDKETRMDDEDRLSVSTFSLLREDLSQFKEDMSSIFSIGSSRDKDLKSTDSQCSQPAERTTNPLSVLKDDLSNIFRNVLSNDEDNNCLAKEDSFKMNVQKAGQTDDTFRNLFRQDERDKVEDGLERRQAVSDKIEGQMTEMEDSQRENTMKDKVKEAEDGGVDIRLYEEASHLSETQHEDTTCPHKIQSRHSSAASCEEDEEREEKPSWEINRFSLRDDETDDTRDQTGADVWWVKNFASYLTFDPNSANYELHLTNCNRTATRVWSDHRSSGHLEQFECCPQVVCREGLLDSVYWEVEWSAGVDIGITSNSISRHGKPADCLLGHNKWSWSLECSEGSYTPCHNNRRFRSSSPEPFTHRVGVYLNWSAGALSFYSVSPDAMVHLHTFTCTFTEPLYPGFWIWAYGGSVSLCQVELDWERLLQ